MDWISNKLYWTDVQEKYIGVVDLRSHAHKQLIFTEVDVIPRGLVVDPVIRYVNHIVAISLSQK